MARHVGPRGGLSTPLQAKASLTPAAGPPARPPPWPVRFGRRNNYCLCRRGGVGVGVVLPNNMRRAPCLTHQRGDGHRRGVQHENPLAARGARAYRSIAAVTSATGFVHIAHRRAWIMHEHDGPPGVLWFSLRGWGKVTRAVQARNLPHSPLRYPAAFGWLVPRTQLDRARDFGWRLEKQRTSQGRSRSDPRFNRFYGCPP